MMKAAIRLLIVLAVTAMLALATTVPAFASHGDHTPGGDKRECEELPEFIQQFCD